MDPVIPAVKATGNPQRWNLYAYCLGNPVNYWDPDGADVVITIQRAYSTNIAYFGVLFLNGERIGITMEPINGCLPAGTYVGNLTRQAGHKAVDFNAKNDKGIPIGIHWGFDLKDSKGCVYLGDDSDWIGSLYGTTAWEKFEKALSQLDKNEKIAVIIIDGDSITVIALTGEEMNKIAKQAERDEWSMMSYYSMWSDPFFVYGPLWAAR